MDLDQSFEMCVWRESAVMARNELTANEVKRAAIELRTRYGGEQIGEREQWGSRNWT